VQISAKTATWATAIFSCVVAVAALAHHPGDILLGPSLIWGSSPGGRWFAYQDPRLLVHGLISPEYPKRGSTLVVDVLAENRDQLFSGGASVSLRQQGEGQPFLTQTCTLRSPGSFETSIPVNEAGPIEVRISLQGPGGLTVTVPLEVAPGVPWLTFAVGGGFLLAILLLAVSRTREESKA